MLKAPHVPHAPRASPGQRSPHHCCCSICRRKDHAGAVKNHSCGGLTLSCCQIGQDAIFTDHISRDTRTSILPFYCSQARLLCTSCDLASLKGQSTFQSSSMGCPSQLKCLPVGTRTERDFLPNFTGRKMLSPPLLFPNLGNTSLPNCQIWTTSFTCSVYPGHYLELGDLTVIAMTSSTIHSLMLWKPS